MYKILKCCLLAIIFCLVTVGCGNQTKKDNPNSKGSPQEELNEIDHKIKNKFNNDYKVTKNDVSSAVNYIQENLDNIDDRAVAKKLYEKGSYLEMAATTGNVEEDNEVKKLGTKTKAYANKVYTSNKNELNKIIDEGRKDFDDFKDKFNQRVDQTIDNFMSFFKNDHD